VDETFWPARAPNRAERRRTKDKDVARNMPYVKIEDDDEDKEDDRGS
jgi:hypothetical protein